MSAVVEAHNAVTEYVLMATKVNQDVKDCQRNSVHAQLIAAQNMVHGVSGDSALLSAMAGLDPEQECASLMVKLQKDVAESILWVNYVINSSVLVGLNGQDLACAAQLAVVDYVLDTELVSMAHLVMLVV